MSDLRACPLPPKREPIAVYDYRDESNQVRFQIKRFPNKAFSASRSDPKDQSRFIPNLHGVDLIPYHLPELLKAGKDEWVFVCEGEKDCDTMASHGFTATTNPGGAGKWKPEFSQYFDQILAAVIIADKDDAGRKHAKEVARSLKETVKLLAVLELPDRGGKSVKDATDFFEAGGTKAEILELVESAQEWTDSNDGSREADKSDTEIKLRSKGPGDGPPWCWVHKCVLRRIREKVADTVSALAVYHALAEISSDEESPRFETVPQYIGNKAGVSPSTVKRRIEDLERIGVVKTTGFSSAAKRRPLTYHLLQPDSSW